MSELKTNALVLFSGGQDSTTCLAWALDRFDEVYTIGFSYGQRHAVELDQRRIVLDKIRNIDPWESWRLKSDVVLPIPQLKEISSSALTDHDLSVDTTKEKGLPNTFLPGRNLLFLTLAGALAYSKKIRNIVAGVCQTDYSGYPDCRSETIITMNRALRLGMDYPELMVRTPLMFMTKADTWKMAKDLGGNSLVNLIIEDTHTCYVGDREHKHPWGYGCGECPACVLRKKGWDEWTNQTMEQGEPISPT